MLELLTSWWTPTGRSGRGRVENNKASSSGTCKVWKRDVLGGGAKNASSYTRIALPKPTYLNGSPRSRVVQFLRVVPSISFLSDFQQVVRCNPSDLMQPSHPSSDPPLAHAVVVGLRLLLPGLEPALSSGTKPLDCFDVAMEHELNCCWGRTVCRELSWRLYVHRIRRFPSLILSLLLEGVSNSEPPVFGVSKEFADVLPQL